MRNKKLLSTVVASALVATIMAVPVMADDGGSVDVDVTTKNAVIRVEVPTTLAVAINQFEKGDSGSQIFSGDFDITNKSEIPVKLQVTSTATLDSASPITLVSSKKAAEDSKEANGEAWLAVAAQTSARAQAGDPGNYIEESGKGIKDLTEANDNVVTFAQGTEDATKATATADQTFYLAAEDTPTVTYTKVTAADADALVPLNKISYAQIYEITAATTITSQSTLDTAVAAGDVYVENGGTITRIEKGTSGTYAAGSTYYTTTGTKVTPGTLAVNKIYVYGEASAATTGGNAGFRYIGKLSEDKTTAWSEADIKKIVIDYDITGVTSTGYDEVKDDCTYGLYGGSSYLSATTLTATANSVTLSLPNGVTLSKVELIHADGTAPITLTNGNQYTSNGTTFAVSASNISNWLKASPAYNKIKLTFSDKKS